MLDPNMMEQVKEELVLLSLVKETRSVESDKRYAFYVNGRPLFSIEEKEKRGKTLYQTYYKGGFTPAIETRDPNNVVKQVQKWIEVETAKD